MLEFLTSTEAEEEFAAKDFVEVILDQTPFENVDILSLETTTTRPGVAWWNGNVNPLSNWETLTIQNDGYTKINATVISGNYSADTTPYLMFFYNDDVVNAETYIGGAIQCTSAGEVLSELVTVPENTKTIVINHRLSGDISAIAEGVHESGRLVDVENEIQDILNSKEKVQDGLIISVVGASTSTKIDKDAYEMTITEDDVGVPLAAYLTYYDYYGLSGSTPVGFSLGGHTFTASEIGKQVYFTPIAEDVGKSIGLALRYSGNDDKKVWWEYLEDLGATVVPVCWSGSSITSHEESETIRKTAHSWHEAQIRKIGVRIPGSMQRKAPDIIIITRGGNDMTHAPYGLLTDGYFDNWNWSYPTTDVVTGGWGILEGLSMWVHKVREAYPFSRIIMATSRGCKRVNYSKFPVNNGIYSYPQYNDAIRSAANFFGCQTIDWDRCGVTFENMYPEYSDDSAITPTHPTQLGHYVMARQAIIDMKSKLDFLHLKHENRNSKLKMGVTYTLNNATSSNMTNTVILGETYTTTIAPTGNISVVIRQNGADITSRVYNPSTGVVTINPVDGDISVEATWTGTSYNITNNLTHVINLNNATTIPELNTYDAWLSSDDGYIKDLVTVTMGGTDITSTAYSDGHIVIPSVTGDITITASATETIGGSYKIFNKRTGLLNGASPTQFTMNDLSKVVVKFRTPSTIDSQAGNGSGGIYGKLFTAMQSVNGRIEFATGSGCNTGVVPQPNTDYISVLDNINQATSSLTIYAGDDENLTTPLGTTTRTATVNWPFCIYGTYSTTVQGYSVKTELYRTKFYDTNGDLIRDYVPATRLSDSVQGSYDRLTGEFVPIVVDQ